MVMNTKQEGFKNTDVGVIPADWEVKELSEITMLMTNGFVGTATTHYTNSENGVLYIQGFNVEENSYNFTGIKRVTRDFHKQHTRSCLREGDLLTIQTGEIGVTTIVPKELEGSNCHALIITRFKPQFYPKFFSYYFNSFHGRNRIKEIETGTTMKHINVGDMVHFKVPYPKEKSEQTAIAMVLSDIDGVIESLDKLIEKKKNIKQGAMQELLTGKKRLPGFCSEWKVETLGSLGSFSKGRGLPKKDISSSGNMRAIPYTAIYTDFNEVIKYEEINNFTSSNETVIIDSPHLLIAGSSNMLENVGKVTAFNNYSKVAVGGDIIIYKTSEDVRFISYLLNTQTHRKKIIRLSQGSTIRHVYASTFKNYEIKVPENKEQSAIAQVLSEMEAEIEEFERERDKYKNLKIGMIQELLTGGIRLKWKS